MTQVNVTYGKNTSAAWLMPFLYDIGEFSGSREKMTRRQTEELAHIIVSTYGHLKVTEIMLFFWWFKCGRYGNFYGSVDPMVILSSLKKFMCDRNEIIDRDEREKRRREFEESRKNAITYEDWLRIKDGMEKENGDERKKNG